MSLKFKCSPLMIGKVVVVEFKDDAGVEGDFQIVGKLQSYHYGTGANKSVLAMFFEGIKEPKVFYDEDEFTVRRYDVV